MENLAAQYSLYYNTNLICFTEDNSTLFFLARYVVHYADWSVISAISPEYKMPFGTLQSYADGPLDNSTGIPFFYIAKVSDTYKNIAYNNTVSMTVTQNEGEYCKQKGWDPESPQCARVVLMGKVG